MKLVIAPDSFKESLSAVEVAHAIQDGWKQVFPHAEYDLVPMSDGGEGMAETLTAALYGEMKQITVTGPFGESMTANIAWIDTHKIAVVESAIMIGLDLVPLEKRNPLLTTSYGLGLALQHAYEMGAETIIVGIGGTATVDGGIGMAQALGVRILDTHNTPVAYGGAALSQVAHIDTSTMYSFNNCSIVVAADVDNPLYGEQGAAYIFGPQKGATPEIVERLEHGMHNFASILERDLSLDTTTDINFSGAGAAGGLGAALKIFLQADIQSGIALVIHYTQLHARMETADLVITGEGKVDGQSVHGKVPFGVLQAAKHVHTPVCVIGGALDDGHEIFYKHGVSSMFSCTQKSSSWEHIQKHAYKNVALVSRAMAHMYLAGAKNARILS